VVVGHRELRIPIGQLTAIETLVRQVMGPGRLETSGDQFVVLGSHVQAAGLDEHRRARRVALLPQFVGAAQQRDVVGMLVVAESNQPRVAVRRAEIVGDVVLLESENTPATHRQLAAGGRAHRTDPDHDHVIPAHRLLRDTTLRERPDGTDETVTP
jgi:hypothetical protein